jgi:hypothetical protein
VKSRRGLVVGAGLLALTGAASEFAGGSGWGGFWLAVIAFGLLVRGPMRRYWESVERDDPAAPAFWASWMFAAMAVGALALGVTQLAGVWLRKDGFRGVLGVAAAAFSAYWAWRAGRDHSRIRDRREEPDWGPTSSPPKSARR